MKKLYTSIVMLLLAISSNAQAPTLEWAGQIEIDPFGYCQAIDTDANGNVYTVGYFEGTADFDPGTGTLNYTAANEVAFIQKLDAAGDLVWTKFISGTSSVRAEDVALDTNANIYITGSFEGTTDFDPGTGTSAKTAIGSSKDMFVLKLDANGDFLWVNDLFLGSELSSSENVEGTSITVDTAGNAFVTGYYRGQLYYDIGTLPNFSTSNGNSDVFILKMNEWGGTAWFRPFGGTGWDFGTSVSVGASGNIYAVGHTASTVDVNPQGGGFNLTSNGQSAIYIKKLDPYGQFIWAKNLTGPTAQSYTNYGKVVIDESENIYLTGHLSGTVDFDPNAGVTELTSQADGDVFIEKIDSNGNMIWVKAIHADNPYSIDLDTNDAVYITGEFSLTGDFDPSIATFNMTSAGVTDIFLQKLDTDGNFAWAQQMGGTSYDLGNAIALDNNNDILLGGYFHTTADLDPGTGTLNFTSAGADEDIFILKLNNCLPVMTALTTTNCFSYTTPSGNDTYTTSGIYNDTLTSACGSDSILVIDLTINTIDVSVTNTDPTLTATASTATYQWLECPAMTEINGATSQAFTPTANGDYAVIVTENGCSDTSTCYTVASVSIDEMSFGNNVSIQPNPTNQNIVLDLGKVYNEVEIQIVNSLGQTVYSKKYDTIKSVNLELNGAHGVYFVTIQTDAGKTVKRVIKK